MKVFVALDDAWNRICEGCGESGGCRTYVVGVFSSREAAENAPLTEEGAERVIIETILDKGGGIQL